MALLDVHRHWHVSGGEERECVADHTMGCWATQDLQPHEAAHLLREGLSELPHQIKREKERERNRGKERVRGSECVRESGERQHWREREKRREREQKKEGEREEEGKSAATSSLCVQKQI